MKHFPQPVLLWPFRLCLCLLILAPYNHAMAGKNYFSNYRVADGLSSENVFYVFQDSRGFLWFGTDYGVSRFDGQQFVNYNASDGLLNDNVFVISEDDLGRIWFGTQAPGLCYFLNDSIYEYEHNDSLQKYAGKASVKLSIDFNDEGVLLLGDGMNGLIRIGSSGKVDLYGGKCRNILEKDRKLITSWYRVRSEETINDRFEFRNSLEDSVPEAVQLDAGAYDLFGSHYALRYNDSTLLVVAGDLYVCLSGKDVFTKKMDYGTDCIYLDREHRIWIGSHSQGVYVYRDIHLRHELLHLLPGKTITHVQHDFQGGIWCSSLLEGVFHFPALPMNHDRQSYTLNSGVKQLTKGPYGIVFCLTNDGKVWEVKHDTYRTIGWLDKNLTREGENYLYFHKDANTIYFKGKVLVPPPAEYRISVIPTFSESQPLSISFDMFIDHEGVKYDFRGKGVYRDEDGKHTLRYGEELEFNRIQCLQQFHDTLWVGTVRGLYTVYNDSLSRYTRENITESRVVDMVTCNGQLAVAIENRGILIFGKGKRRLIGSGNGLISLKFNSLFADEDGTLFIATKDGLYYTRDFDNNLVVYRWSGQQSVLPKEIQDVAVSGEHIFIGSKEGLETSDRKSLFQKIIPPKTHIGILKVSGLPQRNHGNVFMHTDNNMELRLSAINYSDQGNLIFAWRMEDDEHGWNYTGNQNIYFEHLPPGEYRIIARSSVLPEIWSEEAVLELTIKPPWWLSFWFIFLLSVTVILSIVFAFVYRGRMLKKRSKKEMNLLMEKTDLEMRALRAQMNPHFVFNTLTSIQHLIHSKQNEKAEFYLEKFSHLLRLVVDKSDETFVPAMDEISILKYYLELENLRYSNKFDYTFNLQPGIDLERVKIPSMILQPFVENAIEHGISRMEGRGLLEVNIEKSNDILIFTITDNGIGRKRAKEISEMMGRKHRSVGMTNVARRISLMNLGETLRSSGVEVIDLVNEEGKARGTRIKLIIPLNATDV